MSLAAASRALLATACILAVSHAYGQIAFGPRQVVPSRHVASAVDINGDGWPDLPGAQNDRTGNLRANPRVGFNLTDDPSNRDIRFADLNGDGCVDAVVNSYAAYSVGGVVDGLGDHYLRVFVQERSDATCLGTFRAVADPLPPDRAKDVRGYGETIVAADFDNDGLVDLYLPYYSLKCIPDAFPADVKVEPTGTKCRSDEWANDSRPSLLLINKTASPSDVIKLVPAAQAGVSLTGYHYGNYGVFSSDRRLLEIHARPESAQAADLDDDGWIDLFVAGQIFINLGRDGSGAWKGFRPMTGDYGLPVRTGSEGELETFPRFDEGAKLIDWNNDGELDLLLMWWGAGPPMPPYTWSPLMYTRGAPAINGVRPFSYEPLAFFQQAADCTVGSYAGAFGLNAYDIDNDGFEDILIQANSGSLDPHPPRLFRNTGAGFEQVCTAALENQPFGRSAPSFADVNRDGRIDMLFADAPHTADADSSVYLNQSSTAGRYSFRVEVLGSRGEISQGGRVVRAKPKPEVPSGKEPTYTRVVDGGSGYMVQTEYPLLIGTPYPERHEVAVTTWGGGARQVQTFDILPGQYARVYAPGVHAPRGKIELLQHDADQNGRADILWFDKASGDLNIWSMDGARLNGAPRSGRIGAVGSREFAAMQVGDFDGDGRTDVLWHSKKRGEATIWTKIGVGTHVELSLRGPGSAPYRTLQVVAIGDFNGDRKSDILLRVEGTHRYRIWYVGGIDYGSREAKVASEARFTTASGLDLVGVGDFDGDAVADIAWRGKDGRISISRGTALNSPVATFLFSRSRWRAAGIADFNGDGRDDILWSNEDTQALDVWYMDHTSRLGDSGPIAAPAGMSPNASWSVDQVRDFDGNGKADILWRIADGTLQVWLTNGRTVVEHGCASCETVGADWETLPR